MFHFKVLLRALFVIAISTASLMLLAQTAKTSTDSGARITASTIGNAELPVEVPKATESALAWMRAVNIHWAVVRLLGLAIPLLFLFTGFGARLCRRCEAICGDRWFWTLTLFACAYLLLAELLVLPFEFYFGYLPAHAMGSLTMSNWLKNESVQLAVRLVLASLLLWLPYRLIARSPRRWCLYGSLMLIPVAFLVMVAWPVWVDPLTTTYKPLNDPALERRIESLAARCGVTHIPIFVGGNSTGVTGLGPTNRIVLQGNLTTVETPDQIEFTIGHELKHYVMDDNWKALAIIAAFLLAGFWLTDRLGRAVLRRFSPRWGFRELSDPASFPLMMFLLTFLVFAVGPFFNLFARHIEFEADRFGLELTHQNHAEAAMFAKQDQSGDVPEWDTFFLLSQATHPSDTKRIEFANTYKPWLQGAPLVYGSVCKSE